MVKVHLILLFLWLYQIFIGSLLFKKIREILVNISISLSKYLYYAHFFVLFFKHLFYLFSIITIPKAHHRALSHPSCKIAIEEEMNALCNLGTWDLTTLSKEKEIVGYNLVFVIKHYYLDGIVKRLKAWLVIYILLWEFFSPMARLYWTCLLILSLIHLDQLLFQLYVKMCFYSVLYQKVYVEQSPRFIA